MQYELPDDTLLEIPMSARITCPELLFDPDLLEKYQNARPIQSTVDRAILKSEIAMRKDLYETIIVVGGTAMLKGLPERLTKEIALRSQTHYEIKVER